MSASPTAQQIIDNLGLIPHPEGGYFVETYRGGAPPMESKGRTDGRGITIDVAVRRDLTQDNEGAEDGSHIRVKRNSMTSIYYMLTSDSPTCRFVLNASDHVHYWHAGGRMEYILVLESGETQCHVLGTKLADGDVMQLRVVGGTYKAARLIEGDFMLLGESVAPGFDFRDFTLLTAQQVQDRSTQQLEPSILAMTKEGVKEGVKEDTDKYYDEAAK